MSSQIVKINIIDNIEDEFGNRNEYIEIPLSKPNLDVKVFLEIIKHGFNKIFPFSKNQSFFSKKMNKRTLLLGLEPERIFSFSLYTTLMKNQMTINKTIDNLLPSKLENISQTLDNYEWNIHVEYRRGFRGDDSLILLRKPNINSDRRNNIYTMLSIQSIRHPDIKGELIFDNFMCLYDRNNKVEVNVGKRFGTINLFENYSEYSLNFRDVKNKNSKFKMLLNTDKSSGIFEVDKLIENFNIFIKKYSEFYEHLIDFKIVIEVSNEIRWRCFYSKKQDGTLGSKKEYYSAKTLRVKENSEGIIFKSLLSLIKEISEFEAELNEDFLLNYNFVDDIIKDGVLGKYEIEQFFETLSLLKY